VLAVVVATQALVFADGGLTALGANVLNMGVVGALLTGGLMLAARRVLPRRRIVLLATAGAGAWLAVMAGAAATAVEIGASGTVGLGTVLPAMLGVHAAIGFGEAVVTVAAVSAVLAARPDLIHGLDLPPQERGAPAAVAGELAA
jgi:cobalt/nickel transport system permease protein